MTHQGHAAWPDRNGNAALLRACRGGSRTAWVELVNRYERLVYAIPLREGLDAEDAADVTQETFATLLRSLDSISEPDRISHWLMTVARRNTWHRRGLRRRQRSDKDTVDTVAVHDHSENTVDAMWVHDAVMQLDEPCRSLVLALFFDPREPSYAEIAVRLGRPVGSIGPLRGRCMDRLKLHLDQRGA